MDNHLHLLVRIDPDVAGGWTDAEVVERWHRLYPPRGLDRKPQPPELRKELVEKLLADANWLQVTRQRLCSLMLGYSLILGQPERSFILASSIFIYHSTPR